MSQNIAKLVIALFFLAPLLVISGQPTSTAAQQQTASAKDQKPAPVLAPQVTKYGGLAGIKNAKGEYLLKHLPRPWTEGYAIAYQVKNSRGVLEDRLFQVLGDQAFPAKPNEVKEKSTSSTKVITTADRVFEIKRSFTWENKSSRLRSVITITNTSNEDVILPAVEFETDQCVTSQLICQCEEIRLEPEHPTEPDMQQSGCDITLSAECSECAECKCGERCKPGQARGFVRAPMDPNIVIPGVIDFIGKLMQPIDVPLLCFSWSGDNLPTKALKPGQEFTANYALKISPRR